ncbi:MAG: hypothetical protein Terrestrivirus1_114 [Terrestrivirus sp.]|uniref:Uncharacterized protein n=1 Tax=Terrestrivirus sp. TaxID=2487775 RepID=A0A3G4ZK75_9VIRU|nr:MAG: hypothetical protein Terrestrivirus1_114 [Terrestrivirus sp.]
MNSVAQKPQIAINADDEKLYRELMSVLNDPASYKPDEQEDSTSSGDFSKVLDTVIVELIKSKEKDGSLESSQVINVISSKLPDIFPLLVTVT